MLVLKRDREIVNIFRFQGFCLDLAQMLDFGAHPINKPLLDDMFPCLKKSADFFLECIYLLYKRL